MIFFLQHRVGTFSQPIWLDNAYCSPSSYTCLTTCESCPSSESVSCFHSEDVTLDCSKYIQIILYIIIGQCIQVLDFNNLLC